MQRNGAIRHDRLDLGAFIAAFVTGLVSYFILHVFLGLHQAIVTIAVLIVMLAYAFVVYQVPRLRVRLDQAGDNAYYLGLLFTLTSMAFALYEFGAIITQGPSSIEHTGIQQIIGNFGIALASTIMGIFLRIVLHQTRVDPADVERASRIELAEASKKVRATLEMVSMDLGRFHDEVRQRSSDVISALVEEACATVTKIGGEYERATKEMITSTANVHQEALSQTQELTGHIIATASEAMKAIERLRGVEPPPLTLSRRLEKVTVVLETVGDQAERIASSLQETADSATRAVESISRTSMTLSKASGEMCDNNAKSTQTILAASERVSAALDAVGQRLVQESALLSQLEAQSRRSAEESERAQVAAVEVLTRLSELTRGLTMLLKGTKAA